MLQPLFYKIVGEKSFMRISYYKFKIFHISCWRLRFKPKGALFFLFYFHLFLCETKWVSV